MLRKTMLLLFCASGWVYGQPADSLPAFEVATIKPSAPSNGRPILGTKGGGPGTRDPSRITYQNFLLSKLVTEAYEVRHNQFSGPSWLETERFDIIAKIPDGTKKEQLPLLLQKLLAERFRLAIRREKKEGTVYELVLGKSGPKLKESESVSSRGGPQPLPSAPPGPTNLDSDGFPVPPTGRGLKMIGFNRRMSMRYTEASMAQFATMLSNQLDRPVTDATGLTAKYDLSLHWVTDVTLRGLGGFVPPPAPSDDDSGPTLFDAVQQQLGLKLEQKKGMIDMIVVDHIDKVPTEN